MDNKLPSDDNSDSKEGNSTVRESLISIAVQFLQNPSIQSSPLSIKKSFLKKKGLTDEEIEVAIKRSGILNNNETASPVENRIQKNNIQVSYPPPPPYPYYQQQVALVQPPSILIRLRDLTNCIIALGGTAFMVVWFYKRFIEPYLFGRKKKEIKKDPVEIEIGKLKQGVERVSISIERLEQKLEFANHRNQADEQELIMHITSLKGLLLNRKQFPATPLTSVAGPAAIPAWQLSESQPPSTEDKKLDSPSNSSNNSSNNSTNNDPTSDSSLELIREQEIINSNK